MNQPLGWELVALDCLVDHSRGITYGIIKTGDPVVGGVPTVRGGDIKRFHIEASTLKRVDPSIAHQFLRTELRGHELVISIRGSVGSVAVVSPDLAGCNVSREVAVIPALPHLIEPEFAKFFLASPSAQSAMAGKVKGVAQQGINLEDLRALDTPLPPLNEQRRIVARIEELTARSKSAKEALQAIPPLLGKFRQSLLAAAFRGDLTAEWRRQNPDVEPAEVLLERIQVERRRHWEESGARGHYLEPEQMDASGLPDLPKGWCWATTEQFCVNKITAGNTPKPHLMSSGHGEVPYIKVYNLTKTGQLDFSKEPTFVSEETHNTDLARSRLLPGDVLMNIVGPPLGKVSIVPDSHPEWNTNQAVVFFRLAYEVPSHFLCFALLTERVLRWTQFSSKATAGQFNIRTSACRTIPIPICPIGEMRAIVEIVASALQFATDHQTRIATVGARLEDADKSILSKAFRGELVPQDPNDEPASILLERTLSKKSDQPKTRKQRG